MGWFDALLRKLLPEPKPVPKRERGYLSGIGSYWEVSGPKGYPELFRALHVIVPEDGLLWFCDSCDFGGALPEFLKRVSMPAPEISRPYYDRPDGDVWYVQATRENLAELAAITEHYAAPEVAMHFQVSLRDTKLIEWFDAFSQEMWLSPEIPEDKIREFCEALSMKYRQSFPRWGPTV